MHSNVSSDAVAADEDTIPIVINDDSGLIFSATQRDTRTLLVISYHWPALFLLFFSIVGVIGNLLVCLAIGTERRLQNRTNWFLFSLALADMLVSGLVIPLAAVKEFIGYWILGPVLCDLWIFLDVCSCTSSIMHIVVISIDRYLAINDPLNTRNRQQKCKILLLIILIWLIAILLSSPMIVLGAINPYNIFIDGQCLINNQFFVTYGSVVSFVIPLIIVIIMYTLTVRRLKEQIRQCQTQLAQEQLARAASLVAKPFLRRHIPTRRAAAAAAAATTLSSVPASSTQSIPMSTAKLRRLQLQKSLLNSEITLDNGEETKFHRTASSQKAQHSPSDRDSSLEENPGILRNSNRQTVTKFSPHVEYACPKNPFCQLKCTCHRHQSQQETQVTETKVNRHCLQNFCCSKLVMLIPCFHRTLAESDSKPCPIPTGSSTDEAQQAFVPSTNKSSKMKRTKGKNWRRLTMTTSAPNPRNKTSAVRNEQKALKVLGVVFAIFVIAWFPFCIMNLLQGVCKRCSINPTILNGLVWLGYVSSTINPLVYTIFNRNFRRKFIALLKFQCSDSIVGNRHFSYYLSHSSLNESRIQRRNEMISNDSRRNRNQREQQEFKVSETTLQE